MKEFFENKRFRIFVLIILDFIVVYLSAMLALILRFDITTIPQEYYDGAVKSLPVYFVITIAVMWIFKLYNRVWTYASLSELFAVIKATLLIGALFVCYHVLFQINMPRSYYFLICAFMATFFSCSRFAKVAIKNYKESRKSKNIRNYVMLIGAGSAANILLNELKSTAPDTVVVCAIDDNPNKKNKYMQGVPIVGNRAAIESSAKKYGATEIIIAMPSADAKSIREVIELCNKTGLPTKILPSVSTTLTSSLSKEVREVRYEDLLGREPVKVNQKGIYEFLHDKVVLVTGGGGSIGSELCRQIVGNVPKTLIIFDIYENCAYDIQNELKRNYPDVHIETLIGSVRDYDRMEDIFREYKPDVVYHAAAHKHVPLMEDSPNEAIKNNCLGTLNVAKLADKYEVDNFVLISTDKAVRPTNVMGASKRICEMIIQSFADRTQHTKFAAVRFGNVLGSNGSVIPLFLKQIENGGPVTVTHKDITRFFMTIPEAVSLVLQAGLFAKGGEIFVLDMGEPVKIYELAENLIKMKGHTPNGDIKIEIVGLRPGEKLYEELLMDEEGLSKTENQMIFIGQPIDFDEEKFFNELDNLIESAENNVTNIKELVTHVCTTYTITDNK